MEQMRKRYRPSFKAKVALEAIKEQKTSAELASLYQVHPGQIRNWKVVVLKGLLDLGCRLSGASSRQSCRCSRL